MKGCATPDNHSLMVHQLADPIPCTPATATTSRTTGRRGRVRQLHRPLGVRAAFPATEQVCTALGTKCYDTSPDYLENARICDELELAVISGWESTAIEDHSGIVDNLRNSVRSHADHRHAPAHPPRRRTTQHLHRTRRIRNVRPLLPLRARDRRRRPLVHRITPSENSFEGFFRSPRPTRRSSVLATCS